MSSTQELIMYDYPFDLEQFDEELFLADEEAVRLSMAKHLDEACYEVTQYLRMVEWIPNDLRREIIPIAHDLDELRVVKNAAGELLDMLEDWWETEPTEQEGVEDRELAHRDDSCVQLDGKAVPNHA